MDVRKEDEVYEKVGFTCLFLAALPLSFIFRNMVNADLI